MCVLKIRLATVLKAYNFIKKRLQYRRFPVNVLKGLGTAFFRTISVVAFQLSYSIREEFLKKKVSGEIAFALINLFQAQIQEPANRSTRTRSRSRLKRLSRWMYSQTWSQGSGIATPNREVPYGLLSRSCFYCPNLITVAPLLLEIEICQSHPIIR